MSDDQELMDVFLEEAQDLIDKMRTELSSLSEESNRVNLGNLFRCAHTLKSSSGIVGFNNLHKLTLGLERIAKAMKDGKREINTELISLLSEGIEVCQRLLNGEEMEGIGGLMEKLGRI